MTHPETDRQLLARYARDGTQAAFEELVRRHAGLVYGAARRWAADPHRADEIAQGVFLLLAQKAGHAGWRDDVGGWLYRAVGYAGRTLRREEQRRKKRETEVARMNREATTPESGWQDVAPVVDAAISTLPRADADAIRLRYLQGVDVATLAQRLGVNEAAARKRISRALDRLRDVLASRGVVASATSIAGMLGSHGTPQVSAELLARLTAALYSGNSAGATAVAGGVKKGLILAKAKVAAAICAAAVVSAGAVAVAITKGGAKQNAIAATRPLPAATQPAGLDPAVIAQLTTASRTVKSLHLSVKDVTTGTEIECWVEDGKRSVLVQRRGATSMTVLAIGKDKWRYAGNGQLIGKGEADAATEYDLRRQLEWFRIPRASIRRDENGDRKERGQTLRAYTVVPSGGRQTQVVWVDERMLPVLAEARERTTGKSLGTMTMEWDVPVPESRFEPPKGTVLDVAAAIEKEFTPAPASPKAEQGGLPVALHRVVEGEDHLLYVVYSSRLTEKAQNGVGRRSPGAATLCQYILGPGGRVAEDLGYIAFPLGRVRGADVVVQWCVLVPKGGKKLWGVDGVRLSFLTDAPDAVIRAPKAPRQTNVLVNTPVAEAAPGTPPTSIAQFAGEAYDAVRRWEPLADEASVDMIPDVHTTSVRSTFAITRDDFVKGVEAEVRSSQTDAATLTSPPPPRLPG